MYFVRVIPYWLLSKATNVAAKDFILEKDVVKYLMNDPYQNQAGELCVIQPVKAQKVVDLLNQYNMGVPVNEAFDAQDAFHAMAKDENTVNMIRHLVADIEEYNLQEVFFHVS